MKQVHFFVLMISFLHLNAQDIPCDDDIIHLPNTPISTDTIAASDTLYSNSIIVEGSTVLFQSPVLLCFENGFEVQAGSIFEVQIDDCLGASSFSLADIFGSNIDLESLNNYSDIIVPEYITKDNSDGNNITDIGATLGRVLFYDKNLSLSQTVSCASCHQQENAFSDLAVSSSGINGTTGRHSMRLVNARFSEEEQFFWDERANTLEDQTTQPIQDHIEMGFSGANGDPDLDSLFSRMSDLQYYPILFDSTYGSIEISEVKMQLALAQFIRSIQSFDGRYDEGRAQVPNNNRNFPNFTDSENRGKDLFSSNGQFDNNGVRTGGGFGCQRCHRAPEFDIATNSRNNGVVGVIGDPSGLDVNNTRSPTLRDLYKSDGTLNGPMMHDGSFTTIDQMIDHYNNIPTGGGNNNLDNRLRPNGQGQQLQITNQERSDLIAFLKTLSGTDLYQNPKWSNPFLD